MKAIISYNDFSPERTLEKTIKNSEKLGFEVYTIHEGLYYKNVIKLFEISSKFDDDWFISIGADQFLLNGAKASIEEHIKKTLDNDNIWRISGYGYDYLWQMKRAMAPAVYKTKYSSQALKISKKLNSEILRPEGFVIREMDKLGYKFVRYKTLEVVTHDFEQYYKDIYRKGYFQASKATTGHHLTALKTTVLNIENKDLDHMIFLQGIDDFINGNKTNIYEKFNIKERNPL